MKRNIMAIVLLVLVLFLGNRVSGENRALIVGIADYGHPRLNLRGPDVDVALMEQIAVSMGFTKSQIKTIKDKRATRIAILDTLEEWCIKSVGPDDKVLFYFSGHGAQVPDFDSEEDDGCDEALVPADVVQRNAMAFITDDVLNRYLGRCKSKQILVILDCCHSGTGTKGMVTPEASGSQEFYAYGKMIMKGDCQCNQPVNMKSIGIVEIGAKKDKSVENVNYITLTAAAQNEVARAAMRPGRGSLFTQSLYYEVSSSKGPMSFQKLRDRVAEKIRMVSEYHRISPHTPQLEGNRRWFNKDFKSFGGRSLEIAPDQQYNGAVQQAASNVQMFDRMLRSSHFAVRVNARKNTFKLDESIRFSVTSTKKGYLNLIELSPNGDVVVLFPNQYSKDNAVNAWQSLNVPGDIGGFAFVGQPPVGASRVIALVTPVPLNLYNQIMGKQAGIFRAISAGEFTALKQSMQSRAIGVVPEKPRKQKQQAGEAKAGEQVEFGAAQIVIKVEK